MFVIALAAVLLSGQDTSSSQRSASDLTRDLNSGPPFKPAPPAQQPTPVQAPAPIPATPGQNAAPPAAGVAPPSSTVTRDLNSAPPSAVRSTAAAPPPSASTPPAVTRPATVQPGTTVRPVAPQPAPSRPSPLQTPARSLTQAPPASPPRAQEPVNPPPAASAPVAPAAFAQGLDPAAVAALPFALELPSGTVLTQSRAGADARIYAVRRGQTPLVMIYTGPASQFPVYDGQVVQAAGRASIVVTEGARRLALEHLFRRSSSPEEIHVWVAAADGADRDLGERIAQSVDAR